MISLRHILVATDFGDPARAALSCAREFAGAFPATLHLVHVARPQNEAEGKRELAALVGADAADTGVKTAVISSAHPGAAIVKYARETKIDLIVVGTHGRSGFSDFFMGSVAQEVVRTAPCPVLTLRAPA